MSKILTGNIFNGVSPTIGTSVIGGSINNVLYIDSLGNLASSSILTIESDIPLLNRTVSSSGSGFQLVNKEYVDLAVTSINVRYYLLDTASGVSDYKNTQITIPSEILTADAKTITADGQYIRGWISPSGGTPSKLVSGIYDLYIEGFVDATVGTKRVKLYWQLVERKADTSEVVIGTSELGDELTTSAADFTIHYVLPADYTPTAGSRIVGKVVANLYGSGNNPTVYLQYLGGVLSNWAVPTNKEVLDGLYLKLDQSTPQTLTASPILNWGTSTRVPYYSGTKTLTDSASLAFDGTTLTAGLINQTAVTGTNNFSTAVDFNSNQFVSGTDWQCRHISTDGTQYYKMGIQGTLGSGFVLRATSSGVNEKCWQIYNSANYLLVSPVSDNFLSGQYAISQARSGITPTYFNFHFTKVGFSASSSFVVPTAYLHLRAGSASANTAPLKFTSGSLNTAPEIGAVEFLTDDFYGTITTGTARQKFVLTAGLTSGRIPFGITNGRLTDNANLLFTSGIFRVGTTTDYSASAGTTIANFGDRILIDGGTGGSSGIWLCNSSHAGTAFFGMKDDTTCGFFVNTWVYTIDNSGNCAVSGNQDAASFSVSNAAGQSGTFYAASSYASAYYDSDGDGVNDSWGYVLTGISTLTFTNGILTSVS